MIFSFNIDECQIKLDVKKKKPVSLLSTLNGRLLYWHDDL